MARRLATASLVVAPLVPWLIDLVVVAAAVEIALQRVGKGLAGLEAVARGNAVAEADQDGPVGGQRAGPARRSAARSKR